MIDNSSGGMAPEQRPVLDPGYQAPFAEHIRREADLIVMARAFLRSSYFPLHAASAVGTPDAAAWPVLCRHAAANRSLLPKKVFSKAYKSRE